MKYWFSFFICIVLFFACEIEQTDNDVYGCCHSDAWNYDSDVTVHVDSVCIYDFVFTNPTEESVWFEGAMETISWTGGDSNLDIRIAIHDADTDLNEVLITGATPNSGTFDWAVNVDPYDVGEKRIYFIQDINSDGVIDTVNDLITYSDNFLIQEDNIEVFDITSPSEGAQWEEGSLQTIEWTGGSVGMPLKITLISSETDESEWFTLGTIISETDNTGSYQWTVECFGECPDGPKWISIQQDWNGEDDDEYGYQYMYGNEFTILPR